MDVLTGGVWESLYAVQDSELKRLAETLPDTLLQSCASSTTAKYSSAFQHWKEWTTQHAKVKVFPADELHFCLYLQHLGKSTKSKVKGNRRRSCECSCMGTTACCPPANL